MLEDGSIIEAPESERLAKVTGDNARLRAEVRQSLARAQRAEAEVARVRSSTKFIIGDLLVQAAKHPRKLLLLPRDLIRLYRLRRHRRIAPEEAPSAPNRAHRSELSDEHAARLLLPRVAAQSGALIALAGALEPVSQRMWTSAAAVTSVLPHDAAALMLDIDPDIAMIDSSAALPGGTWAHLGDTAATDRSIAALAMVTAARERGRPSVFFRTTSRTHTAGLDWLADRCDLVVDGPGSGSPSTWHPGVDLGAWVYTPSASGNPSVAVLGSLPSGFHKAAISENVPLRYRNPTAPMVTALTQLISQATVAVLWSDNTHASASHLAILGALARGARVVVRADSEQADVLHGLNPGAAVISATDVSQLSQALDDAIRLGPLTLVEHWEILRTMFHAVTTPVTLDDLARRLGIGAQPMAVRHVALIDDPSISTENLLAFLNNQDFLPRELITSRDLSDRAQDSLQRLSVSVNSGPTDTPTSAQRTDCALVASVAPTSILGAHPFTLTDAVIGIEISESPAVFIPTEQESSAAAITLSTRSAALAGLPARALPLAHTGWTL